MDLVSTVRKEGSRGGRGDFKWSDVQSSTHRENYLGHSLMAPVGRWQKGRDLNWYAKGDEENTEDAAEKAARERKEEIRLIKEAEQDALARALGYEVAPRNPNLEALGDKKEVDRVLTEATEGDGEADGGKGVGFGAFGSGEKGKANVEERIEGNAEMQDAELSYALREYRRRHGDEEKRRRSRSRDRDRDRDKDRERGKRKQHRQEEDQRWRRSGSAERTRRRHSRSRSLERPRRRHSPPRSRSRDRPRRDDRRSGSVERPRRRRSRSRSRSRNQDRPRRDDRGDPRRERSRSPRRRDPRDYQDDRERYRFSGGDGEHRRDQDRRH